MPWHGKPLWLETQRAGVAQGNGGGVGSGGTFAPDRTNNVEQVSVPNLPPGDVSIEVTLPTPLLHMCSSVLTQQGLALSWAH